MKASDALFLTLDTETTGLDYASGDRIIEFACLDPFGSEFQMLVNPGRPIPCEASAISHLTDADVVNALPHDLAMQKIESIVMQSYIVVAHNAEFDRSFLPCLNERKWLCSKRLAQHIFPDSPKYSNQVLRYYLGGAGLDLRGSMPHRALADVIVTRFLLDKLLPQYLLNNPDDIGAMLALAESPIRMKTVPFGKHRGVLFRDCPLDYIQWALSSRGITNMNIDLRYTFECEIKERA